MFLALKPDEKPLVAVFRQSAGAAFPGLVSDTVVAAGLDQPDEATLREWRKGLRRESHKVVAWVWGMYSANLPANARRELLADVAAVSVFDLGDRRDLAHRRR